MKTITLSFELTDEEVDALQLFEGRKVVHEKSLSLRMVDVFDDLFNKGLIERTIVDWLEYYEYTLMQHSNILEQL